MKKNSEAEWNGRAALRHQRALDNSYRSVNLAFEPPKKAAKLLLGVKNSPSIKPEWISVLEPLYFLHTKDICAHGGRALDTAMTNPLTGRCMTGSSSGTAVNVLLGINDLGLGTDGGGSVIYPAMAVNIYSVMLAGLGFQCASEKTSTDNIAFRPSLGLMGFHREPLIQALNLLLPPAPPGQKDVIIAGDSASLGHFKLSGKLIEPPDTDERPGLLAWLEGQFKRADVLLLRESQIDICGYGDSVLGFSSPYFRQQQKLSGKRLGKVLNMAEASVFTVPDSEAGSGFLIIAKKGRAAFDCALGLFQSVREARTQVFLDYFSL